MKLFDFFKQQKASLPKPKSQLQEVLYELITKENVSIFHFPYLPKFSTRISDLRNELNIQTVKKTGISKYGNQYWYCIHWLEDDEVEKAVNLYLRLNKI